MTQKKNALWLSVSSSLKCFDQRLLSQLTKYAAVQRWDYCQTLDEPCDIEDVVTALHRYLNGYLNSYLKAHDGKMHLLGHGVSGVVALLYARRYPEYVASVTLLSVSAQPAINWQAHYYALRQLLPCSREIILGQMVKLLFGEQPARFARAISQLLAKDLDSNLTLHSLAHHSKVEPGGIEVPLLVCNGGIDSVTQAPQPSLWHDWMKPQDRLWQCIEGRHFFHFYHAPTVAGVIANHWHQSPAADRAISTDQLLDCPEQEKIQIAPLFT